MKYSKVRSLLGIEPGKKDDLRLAAFTHYLQNYHTPAGEFFREAAGQYVRQRSAELKLGYVPALESLLPDRWDVAFPPNVNPDFTFIDLFAGIGGFRVALQNLNGKCVFTSEWNKYAKQTYEVNFGEGPFGDITTIDETQIPGHDILTAGFPCQPFSLAGVSKKNSLGREHGFLDQTQGTLFFDVARIIKEKRPRAFLLENVKNLVSHDRRKTFPIILQTLRELDYHVHYRVLDGRHYVPQHRERIVIVGFDNQLFDGKADFRFPALPPVSSCVADILDDDETFTRNFTLSDELWRYLRDYAEKHRLKGNGFGLAAPGCITRTLSARYHKDGSEILIPQHGANPRRLTPRECARLQGYPDDFRIVVSNTQAYRQFGNSVVVPLMQAVGEEILRTLGIGEERPYLPEVASGPVVGQAELLL